MQCSIKWPACKIKCYSSTKFLLTVTVHPWFFKHYIIGFPDFSNYFLESSVFPLEKTFNLPRIFGTSVFWIPHFSEPFSGSLGINTDDILHFYAEFLKIRVQVLENVAFFLLNIAIRKTSFSLLNICLLPLNVIMQGTSISFPFPLLINTIGISPK